MFVGVFIRVRLHPVSIPRVSSLVLAPDQRDISKQRYATGLFSFSSIGIKVIRPGRCSLDSALSECRCLEDQRHSAISCAQADNVFLVRLRAASQRGNCLQPLVCFLDFFLCVPAFDVLTNASPVAVCCLNPCSPTEPASSSQSCLTDISLICLNTLVCEWLPASVDIFPSWP